VSSFSLEWLALREPDDRRARNTAVLATVARSIATHPSVTIVDLACGSGATLRAVSGALPQRQSWRLIDNNLSLLARVPPAAPSANVTVRAIPLDLAHDLETALDGPVDLVTTSAFLDLVSAEWIERLVTEIAVRKLRFYAALTYDGRVALEPADPSDAAIIAAFHRHQCTDKGFGPALGPAAAATAIGLFERIGYTVERGRRTRSRRRSWQALPAPQRRSAGSRQARSKAGLRAARACGPRKSCICGSVISIFLRIPAGGVDEKGHSRTTPRRRAGRTEPAAGLLDPHVRWQRACSSHAPSRE